MEKSHQKPLRLALVGMSGAGKSYWTRRLASLGYPTVSCDDQIEAKLESRLAAGGYSGINGVAAWMGWPNNATYLERENEYLTLEIGALDEVLSDLERNREKSLVLDTTGSVIYAGNNLLMRLRRQMTVIYLAASPEERGLLIERYLKDPKPVLWRGAFQAKAGETPHQTVTRCYPNLIAARRQSYEALAHCTLQVAELRGISRGNSADNVKSDAETFLKLVREKVERYS